MMTMLNVNVTVRDCITRELVSNSRNELWSYFMSSIPVY